MHSLRLACATSLLLLAAFLTGSCGSGNPNSNRQLLKISVAPNPDLIAPTSYIATGTYSAPPITVAPLPVFWYSIDPPDGYQLTPTPYVACNLPHGSTVTAIAPVNPNAPTSGPIGSTPMVQGSATLSCP